MYVCVCKSACSIFTGRSGLDFRRSRFLFLLICHVFSKYVHADTLTFRLCVCVLTFLVYYFFVYHTTSPLRSVITFFLTALAPGRKWTEMYFFILSCFHSLSLLLSLAMYYSKYSSLGESPRFIVPRKIVAFSLHNIRKSGNRNRSPRGNHERRKRCPPTLPSFQHYHHRHHHHHHHHHLDDHFRVVGFYGVFRRGTRSNLSIPRLPPRWPIPHAPISINFERAEGPAMAKGWALRAGGKDVTEDLTDWLSRRFSLRP